VKLLPVYATHYESKDNIVPKIKYRIIIEDRKYSLESVLGHG